MSQVTEAMIEAGAEAYHNAVAKAQAKRVQRNDLHEKEGRGRLAPEQANFPIDWLAEVYLAMSSASPPIEGRYTSDAAGQIYRDGSLYLQVSLNTRPDDRKAIAAGVAAILNDPSPPVEQSEDQCARCKGVRAKLAEGRDPEELCDPCYDDSIAALTPPPVTVSVDPAIIERVRRRSESLARIGAEQDASDLRAILAALKEGHSLSTVSGVVK